MTEVYHLNDTRKFTSSTFLRNNEHRVVIRLWMGGCSCIMKSICTIDYAHTTLCTRVVIVVVAVVVVIMTASVHAAALATIITTTIMTTCTDVVIMTITTITTTMTTRVHSVVRA